MNVSDSAKLQEIMHILAYIGLLEFGGVQRSKDKAIANVWNAKSKKNFFQ